MGTLEFFSVPRKTSDSSTFMPLGTLGTLSLRTLVFVFN
jgi:hypothetical protein